MACQQQPAVQTLLPQTSAEQSQMRDVGSDQAHIVLKTLWIKARLEAPHWVPTAVHQKFGAAGHKAFTISVCSDDTRAGQTLSVLQACDGMWPLLQIPMCCNTNRMQAAAH